MSDKELINQLFGERDALASENHDLRQAILELSLELANEKARARRGITKSASDDFRDGTSIQKAFWEGFERGAMSDNANIRHHWNEYVNSKLIGE